MSSINTERSLASFSGSSEFASLRVAAENNQHLNRLIAQAASLIAASSPNTISRTLREGARVSASIQRSATNLTPASDRTPIPTPPRGSGPSAGSSAARAASAAGSAPDPIGISLKGLTPGSPPIPIRTSSNSSQIEHNFHFSSSYNPQSAEFSSGKKDTANAEQNVKNDKGSSNDLAIPLRKSDEAEPLLKESMEDSSSNNTAKNNPLISTQRDELLLSRPSSSTSAQESAQSKEISNESTANSQKAQEKESLPTIFKGIFELIDNLQKELFSQESILDSLSNSIAKEKTNAEASSKAIKSNPNGTSSQEISASGKAYQQSLLFKQEFERLITDAERQKPSSKEMAFLQDIKNALPDLEQATSILGQLSKEQALGASKEALSSLMKEFTTSLAAFLKNLTIPMHKIAHNLDHFHESLSFSPASHSLIEKSFSTLFLLQQPKSDPSFSFLSKGHSAGLDSALQALLSNTATPTIALFRALTDSSIPFGMVVPYFTKQLERRSRRKRNDLPPGAEAHFQEEEDDDEEGNYFFQQFLKQ